MQQYCKGTENDAEEIVDFANYVFSKSFEPHDFKQLIPKLYADGRVTQHLHYLIKEDDKIRAMVCVQPVEFSVAGQRLKVGCVGTVSVHPYARGRGYMKQLVGGAVADMKAQGFSYSVLGGQRQRYEYFGYAPAGIELDFLLTAANLRHKYGSLDAGGISFQELTGSEDALLDAAYELYRTRPITGARSREDFYIVSRTWNSRLYAICRDGVFAGYLSDRDGVLNEIELTDVSLLPAVCKAFFEMRKLERAQILLPAFSRDKIAVLSDFCEGCTIGCQHNYHIMDYPAVIRAFMTLKSSYAPLADGRLVLEIQGNGTMEIAVKGNTVSVNPCCEKPDVSLPPLQAAGFLFSPVYGYAQNLPDCARGWFPLPLYTPPLDYC